MKQKYITAMVVVGLLLITSSGQFLQSTEKFSKRPAEWAQPVAKPGAPNLFKVSEALYRGAQPTGQGMAELKKMGIKTIINLRSFHSDNDEMVIEDANFKYIHIYMKAWHPEDEEVVRFLKDITDKQNHPVFVHCMHGADRTGTMCAIYRMAVMGWSRDRALEEMIMGGFGYHPAWDQYILPYLKTLDIDKIKKEAGIK